MAKLSTSTLRERVVELREDMLKIARGYCDTEEDAEDFVQTRIMWLLQREKEYDPQEDPNGRYILGFLQRSLDTKRDRRRDRQAELQYTRAQQSPQWDPLSVLDEHPTCEDDGMLRECLLASVPPEHIEVLCLRILQHAPTALICSVTGMPKWKVENICTHERRNIRRKAKVLGLLG